MGSCAAMIPFAALLDRMRGVAGRGLQQLRELAGGVAPRCTRATPRTLFLSGELRNSKLNGRSVQECTLGGRGVD